MNLLESLQKSLSERFEQARTQKEIAERNRQFALAFEAARQVGPEEIRALEANGNSCGDWSLVRAADALEAGRIHRTRFDGRVILGTFSGMVHDEDGLPVPTGLDNCRVSECFLGNAAYQDIGRLSRYWVEDGVLLAGIREATCARGSRFALGSEIHPGAETGLRSVLLWEEMDLDYATSCLRLHPEDRKELKHFFKEYLHTVHSDFGHIGAGSIVTGTSLRSSWIGPGALIRDACEISESLVLSSHDEPCVISSGAMVRSSLLQYGVEVDGGAQVTASAMLEHSGAAAQACTRQSILGPGTHIEKGEVNSCLLGPFVGFHHQSLLIAAIWPEGRGNIGYGANIGSNHTGKKADQEIRPGWGNFFGLSASVKFPANFEEAPHSLIATGVTALPQRLRYPFSLINTPTLAFSGVSPARNEIFPGWTWWSNAYALLRNVKKYRDRDKSRRNQLHNSIFQPWIATLCLDAVEELSHAKQLQDFYTDEHFPGLGKNWLTEKSRKAALESYNDFLLHYLYAWKNSSPGLWWRVDAPGKAPTMARLEEFSPDRVAQRILERFSSDKSAEDFLKGNIGTMEVFQKRLVRSLERENDRGTQIFDDYEIFHGTPGDDPIVRQVTQELKELEQQWKMGV